MGWKSWAYSGLLLMLLLIVGLLTSRGIVKSVVNQGDIHLEADAIEYFQGDTITFLGTLDFTGDEQAAIRRVALVLTGASVVEIDLPLEEGVHTLSGAPEFGGELQVAVSYQQISLLPTPTGTPGGQFKGIFQGVDNDAEIILRINWEIGKSSDMVGNYQAKLVVEFGENEDSSESTEVQLSILPGKCGDYNLDRTVNTRDVVIYLQVARQFHRAGHSPVGYDRHRWGRRYHHVRRLGSNRAYRWCSDAGRLCIVKLTDARPMPVGSTRSRHPAESQRVTPLALLFTSYPLALSRC